MENLDELEKKFESVATQLLLFMYGLYKDDDVTNFNEVILVDMCRLKSMYILSTMNLTLVENEKYCNKVEDIHTNFVKAVMCEGTDLKLEDVPDDVNVEISNMINKEIFLIFIKDLLEKYPDDVNTHLYFNDEYTEDEKLIRGLFSIVITKNAKNFVKEANKLSTIIKKHKQENDSKIILLNNPLTRTVH